MKSKAEQLIAQCERLNIELEHNGRHLTANAKAPAPPKLMEQLKQHSGDVIDTLESRRIAAVRYLVKQILLGEFDGCDSDTRQTLFKKIGPLPPMLGHFVLQKLCPKHDQHNQKNEK